MKIITERVVSMMEVLYFILVLVLIVLFLYQFTSTSIQAKGHSDLTSEIKICGDTPTHGSSFLVFNINQICG